MSPRLAFAALAFHAAFAHAAPDATGAREVHGVADAFARPGVALAWGVLRGKSEADTIVVVRVLSSASEFAFVAADGIDPFTQQRKTLRAPTRASGGVDLEFPRAHFADFPRTELKFAADENATAPSLIVYYLGVPDTTPEFPTRDALGRYLAERLAREQPRGGVPK
jgi:hypothetical protein